MRPGPPRTAILTGPTATGKSALALGLAERRGGIELVNADSLLVYRGMDIGTAKPTREERNRVPHHLIDLRDPPESFTAGDFVRAAQEAIAAIHQRGNRALIVGGTGFYLKALIYGMWEGPPADPALRAELEKLTNDELQGKLRSRDPAAALRIGKNDRYRLIRSLEVIELTGKTPTELERKRSSKPDPAYEFWVIDRPDEELRARITERTRAMLGAGLVEEVRGLVARFPGARALGAVGYAQTVAYLEGKRPSGREIAPGLEGLRQEIELATRQLVKRQRTWFRGQKHARWFSLDRDLPMLGPAFDEIYGKKEGASFA